MSIEELANICAEAMQPDWPRKDENGDPMIPLTVTRKRKPGADQCVPLLGSDGPLSSGPLDHVGGKQYTGLWSATRIVAWLAASGLVDIEFEDSAAGGDA